MSKKKNVAILSVASNTFLIIIKLIVGTISGSVSILSEAIHSGMDLIAAIIAFFSVRISDQPADPKHPYGHGKFENISGVIEALLIFAASIWIIYEAVQKMLIHDTVDNLGYGFVVMFISAIVNFFVSRRLYKVAHETESIALEADALHLKADVITSAGVGVGLLLIVVTGLHWLDPIVAILVALFIMKESYVLLKRSYSPLLDTALTDNEMKTINQSITKFSPNFHHLRTRRAGHYKFVDFHIEMAESTTIGQAHALCDAIEDEIKQHISNVEVTIHVETPDEK
ncbi:MAG: cation diffusion facilitator family transporter [Lentimicrobiaceae bacterium]|nr:cation diffusion facilitator family transporter [Lentimicrobiaceae bacterium]